MKFLIVDLDHTLSHAHWRDDMLDAKDWDHYHGNSVNDKPVTEMISLINSCKNDGWTVVVLTTRPEKWRMMTNTWLINNQVMADELLMRPDKDFRSSAESKLAIFKEWWKYYSEDEEHELIVIDDQDGVVNAFKGAGITVLQASVKVMT